MIPDVFVQEVEGHKNNFVSLRIPNTSEIWVWQMNLTITN
jgi:hypothetical protein